MSFRYPSGLGRPFLWAHRGASASALDNTLAAFLLAHEQGADGVELDAHLTADGVAAVVHDPWVSPVTWRLRYARGIGGLEVCVPTAELVAGGIRVGLSAAQHGVRVEVGPGRAPSARVVGETDWAELSSIVRGYDRDGRPLHIPRLEEVLEALPAPMAVYIEVKTAPYRFPDLTYPGIVDTLIALVRRYRFEERAICASFDHRLLRRLAASAPDIATVAIYWGRAVDAPALARAIPARHLSMELPYTDADDIRTCHDAGVFVSVGGLGSAADYARVAHLGADAAMVDDPRWAHPAAEPAPGTVAETAHP